VLFLDLDDFKRVNDTLGHSVGDELIVAVAQRLMNGSRDGDMVARLGGDEFAVLLNEVSPEEALRPAQRFLAELKTPFHLCGRTVVVRASGGLAVSEEITNVGVEQRALDLLKHADLAMYASKVQRTRSVTVFHEQMQREMNERLAMESDMHRALADAQFYLDYQPIVDAGYGTVRAVEALLRWQHPHHGVIAPAEFIEVAEQTGLIVPLTLWVVRNAATQLVQWDLEPETRGLSVALNISGRLVVEPGIGAAVARELHHVGIDPSRIILEITESLLMEDHGVEVHTLCQLRALGMRLSVDDFGTGYSSLSRLTTLPIDEVKIDRSFIDRLDVDAGRTIVTASIAMAHGLGLRVVAEGVETERQFTTLQLAGCDDVQGFLFSRPVTPEAITEMFSNGDLRSAPVAVHETVV
jgi:diguanylate cyclase (GGDEF)-like protein